MIDFAPMISVWLIAGTIVPLGLGLLWMEWNRKFRFKTIRLLAVVLLVLALAGLLLRPGYHQETSNLIILLTPDYKTETADSLLRIHKNPILLHYNDTKPYQGSSLISSTSELINIGHEIRYIAGNGLPVYILELTSKKNFEFISGNVPEGIISIAADKKIHPYRENFISGTINNPSAATWLYLEGPGGKEDSIFINNTGQQSFNFSFVPKQSGRFIYAITTKYNDGNSVTSLLPVEVKEPKTSSVLFIQDYPTFEAQYLKQFLSKQNHKLILRSQVSKGVYHYEYINTSTRTVNTLNPDILSQFDLLIMDGESQQKLSGMEQKFIHESVRNGLGLIVLTNQLKEQKTSNLLFPFSLSFIKTDTISLELDRKKQTLSALPVRVQALPGIESIKESNTGILSGYRQVGMGKIGFQFLLETYRLILNGDSISYSSLWAPLLEKVSREKSESSKITIQNTFPIYPDNPIDIQLISTQNNIQLMMDSLAIALQEDMFIDDIWTGKTWTDKPGWHTIKTNYGDENIFYVSNPNDWVALNTAHQIHANHAASSGLNGITAELSLIRKEINPLIFFLIFLFSIGFIWLAPKL